MKERIETFKPRQVRSVGGVATILTLGMIMAVTAGCGRSGESSSSASATKTASTLSAYEGTLDVVNCKVVSGWVWDQNHQTNRLKVQVFDGSALLVTVSADAFRQDLLDAHKGDGRYSFSVPLPGSLKDGQPHTIRAKVAGTDFDLQNTGKVVTCSSP